MPQRRIDHRPARRARDPLADAALPDGLGPWLAEQWGALADLPPDLLAQIAE